MGIAALLWTTMVQCASTCQIEAVLNTCSGLPTDYGHAIADALVHLSGVCDGASMAVGLIQDDFGCTSREGRDALPLNRDPFARTPGFTIGGKVRHDYEYKRKPMCDLVDQRQDCASTPVAFSHGTSKQCIKYSRVDGAVEPPAGDVQGSATAQCHLAHSRRWDSFR